MPSTAWRRSAWFLARIEGLAALGSEFAPDVEFSSPPAERRAGPSNGSLAWLGTARFMPSRSARSSAGPDSGDSRSGRPRPGVAYFVDTFANLFDPTWARRRRRPASQRPPGLRPTEAARLRVDGPGPGRH